MLPTRIWSTAQPHKYEVERQFEIPCLYLVVEGLGGGTYRAQGERAFDKEIVNQATGEKQGSVSKLIFDENTRSIVALLVGSMIDRERVVRWASVESVGEVIVIGGEAELTTLGDDPEVADLHKKGHKITGTDIVSEEGEKIGTVGDLFVNERGEVVGYEVSRGMISDLRGRKFLPIENIRAAGKDAIIASNPELLSVEDAEKKARR